MLREEHTESMRLLQLSTVHDHFTISVDYKAYLWLSIRLVCIRADGPTTFSRSHWIVVKAGRTSCIRACMYMYICIYSWQVIVFVVRISRCDISSTDSATNLASIYAFLYMCVFYFRVFPSFSSTFKNKRYYQEYNVRYFRLLRYLSLTRSRIISRGMIF